MADVVSYLLERMPVEEIERYRKEGVSLEEVADALERMEARGELPVEDAPDTGFVPFDPFVPPDASKLPAFPLDSLPPSLPAEAPDAAVTLRRIPRKEIAVGIVR